MKRRLNTKYRQEKNILNTKYGNIPIIKNFPSSIPLFNLKIAQIKIMDKIKKVEKINGYQMVFIPKFTLNC